MNLGGRSFRNLQTNKIIKVKDSFENITILEGGEKMDTREVLNTSKYVEHIDPSSFFDNKSVFNTFAEKIKSINLDNIKESYDNSGSDMPDINDSAVIGYSDPEQEKLELMKKYENLGFDVDSINRQNEVLSKISGDENIPVVKPFVPQTKINDHPIVVNEGVEEIQPKRERQEDPILQMFRNVKRTVDLNLNIEIKNKIPRIDFIDMMEDSYETSIIDFLAEEFTRQILNDPDQIKSKIIDEIKNIVYKKSNTEPNTQQEKTPTKKRKTTT